MENKLDWTEQDLKDLTEGYRNNTEKKFKKFKKMEKLSVEDKIVDFFMNESMDMSFIADMHKMTCTEVQKILENKGVL